MQTSEWLAAILCVWFYKNTATGKKKGGKERITSDCYKNQKKNSFFLLYGLKVTEWQIVEEIPSLFRSSSAFRHSE